MGDVERQVSVERVVAATPAVVFDILTDPHMHLEIDGSGMLQHRLGGPDRLVEGSRFGMHMRLLGLPYVIRNVVVEYERDRLIAWRHLFRHRWRYELTPTEGGTLVRETFDWSTALPGYASLLEVIDVPDAHVRNITRTLENLARVAAERQAELDGDVAG